MAETKQVPHDNVCLQSPAPPPLALPWRRACGRRTAPPVRPCPGDTGTRQARQRPVECDWPRGGGGRDLRPCKLERRTEKKDTYLAGGPRC